MAEQAASAVPVKRKTGIPWILIGFLGMVLAGAGGGFLYFRLFKTSQTAEASAAPKAAPAEAVQSTLSLDPFLVNLADKDEVRFLKATFRFGLAGLSEGEELSKDTVYTASMRDAIISLLTSKTSEQVLSPEGKEALRREILTKVNSLPHKGKISEVYIVDFVVQL